MLWLSLFLPDLPLLCAMGGVGLGGALSGKAIGVADGPENRPFLRACNRESCAAGIAVGMGVAQARSLHHDLIVLPRQDAEERQALIAAAHLLLTFTPMVAIEPDGERHCVVMELSASVNLFGGIAALARKIIALMRNAENTARFGAAFFGLAPTPLAAELFARQRAGGHAAIACLPGQPLAAALRNVPLTCVPWLTDYIATLHTLGIFHLGALLQLPREGLAQRFGAQTLRTLDRCAGHAPDVRAPFIPAAQFEAQMECILPMQEGPLLMGSVAQLLAQLAQWLQARASGARAFEIIFDHSREAKSTYALTTHAPMRDVKRWSILLTEHFQRAPLAAPVHRVRLRCAQAYALGNDNATLIPLPQQSQATWDALIDRLHARLGAQAVYTLRTAPDHRPEHAQKRNGQTQQHALTPMPKALRPTFLLPRARALIVRDAMPQYQGALALLSAPERIQSGWWDDAPIERDYFIARNAQGTLCWIYRALNEPGAWYLHGFFA